MPKEKDVTVQDLLDEGLSLDDHVEIRRTVDGEALVADTNVRGFIDFYGPDGWAMVNKDVLGNELGLVTVPLKPRDDAPAAKVGEAEAGAPAGAKASVGAGTIESDGASADKAKE